MIEQVAREVSNAFQSSIAYPGAFYGPAGGISLGVGLVTTARYPLFDPVKSRFATVEGAVYVLTHECDLDGGNQRHFNDLLLVCPIITLEDALLELTAEKSERVARSILTAVARNEVFRVFFMPAWPNGTSFDPLRHGGLLNLNQISSTHVTMVDAPGGRLCALSEYAQGILDLKLRNHLLRPKDEALARLR